jgi:hypothetical protein
MVVPNRELAVVTQAKITDYLLSESHPDGRHKCQFFKAFGYSLDHWEFLAGTIRQHILDYEVRKTEDSPFGTRYVVEGIIVAPDGRTPLLRTVWFIRHGEEVPQFVTAYPLSSDSQSNLTHD